jgi:hypothetical protein
MVEEEAKVNEGPFNVVPDALIVVVALPAPVEVT